MMKLIYLILPALGAALLMTILASRRDVSSSATAISERENVASGKTTPVIVELFTSEGCSSCPPADAVLSRLDQTQPVAGAEVIALSEHVDYWNYIGWSDPFSSAAYSARQESYAAALGRDGVYTPQMVVDGQIEFVGSNQSKAQEAIARAARLPKAQVEITRTQTDARLIKFAVKIAGAPTVSSGDLAEVLFAITENGLSSNVARGENSGRRLAHRAVVRELRALGRVDPSTKSFAGETSVLIADGWKRENVRAIVFVQERAHRRILGASSVSLANQ